MAYNNSIVTGGSGENAAVADVVLDVADDGTFGDGSDGQHVADHEGGLLAAVDELPGVEALGGDEELRLLLVAEGVAECHLGERGAATGVVDDVGDDALEVAVALAEVEAAEPRRTLAVVSVRLEHRPSTLTLSANHPSHSDELCVWVPRRWKKDSEEVRVFASCIIYSGGDIVFSLT